LQSSGLLDQSSGRRQWLGEHLLRRLLPHVWRIFKVIAAAVVLGGVISMVAFGVAFGYSLRAAGLFNQAAAACDALGNSTNSSIAFSSEASTIFANAGTAASVQNIIEAAVLLILSTAFLVFVSLCCFIFRRAELVAAHALQNVERRPGTQEAVAIVDDSMHAAAQQRRRLTAACIVVLVTFPVRAAFDCLQGYAYFNVPYNPTCGVCEPCQSQGYLIQTWINYSPEFFPVVVAISSPVPMTVSLWLITSAHARAYAISLSILRLPLGKDKNGIASPQ
jgi:hypothetical protein